MTDLCDRNKNSKEGGGWRKVVEADWQRHRTLVKSSGHLWDMDGDEVIMFIRTTSMR